MSEEQAKYRTKADDLEVDWSFTQEENEAIISHMQKKEVVEGILSEIIKKQSMGKKADSSFMDRLKEERYNLMANTDKLFEFMGSDKFDSISITQQGLLECQLNAMRLYLSILNMRVDDLESM